MYSPFMIILLTTAKLLLLLLLWHLVLVLTCLRRMLIQIIKVIVVALFPNKAFRWTRRHLIVIKRHVVLLILPVAHLVALVNGSSFIWWRLESIKRTFCVLFLELDVIQVYHFDEAAGLPKWLHHPWQLVVVIWSLVIVLWVANCLFQYFSTTVFTLDRWNY